MDIYFLLFDDVESLDVFGPVEVFGHLDQVQLHYVSAQGGLIHTYQKTPIQTESWDRIQLDQILLIPGGNGTRPLAKDDAFISALKRIASQAQYVLTVCTGTALLAKTGLLDGLKATSNKIAFDWVQSVNPNVELLPSARWVHSGKYYTSSGVSAGMDMALAFVSDLWGYPLAKDTARQIEYIWNEDPHHDPFARK